MFNHKKKIFILLIFCLIVTAMGIYFLGFINPDKLQIWLKSLGIWTPILYIILYTLGTLLILPSTPLNLVGGALFGVWWGTFWTSIAALIAAIISFVLTRSIGRNYVARKFKGKWEVLDAELYHGGLFYMFAIRLLPIIPYGIVNFAAGLTSISFRNYIIGTALGTVPGILPFVLMGSGLHSLSKGNIMPLMIAFTLTGILVGVTTWYRRRRQIPKKLLEKK